MKLLLAEDEKDLSRALSAILAHNKYEIDAVYDGTAALDHGLSENYDGIILDIMMPGRNGLDVLKELRASGIVTPVLMLTAKSEIEDRIAGLDLGADDYLTKPFAMGELLARVRAMTRRKADFTPAILTCGNTSLDRANFELSAKKASLRLGSKEFQMLEMLMENPEKNISTGQFMERIWSGDTEATEDVVWIYVTYLRKKLASVGADVAISTADENTYRLEVAL